MAVIREIRARIRVGLCWRPIYARVSEDTKHVLSLRVSLRAERSNLPPAKEEIASSLRSSQ